MIRPRAAHLPRERVWPLLLALLVYPIGVAAMAQQAPPPDPEETPGQFFTVTEPITSETIPRIRAAATQVVDSSGLGREGEAADPGLRVRPRRDRAGHQRVRRLLTTWPI